MGLIDDWIGWDFNNGCGWNGCGCNDCGTKIDCVANGNDDGELVVWLSNFGIVDWFWTDGLLSNDKKSTEWEEILEFGLGGSGGGLFLIYNNLLFHFNIALP